MILAKFYLHFFIGSNKKTKRRKQYNQNKLIENAIVKIKRFLKIE